MYLLNNLISNYSFVSLFSVSFSFYIYINVYLHLQPSHSILSLFSSTQPVYFITILSMFLPISVN